MCMNSESEQPRWQVGAVTGPSPSLVVLSRHTYRLQRRPGRGELGQPKLDDDNIGAREGCIPLHSTDNAVSHNCCCVMLHDVA